LFKTHTTWHLARLPLSVLKGERMLSAFSLETQINKKIQKTKERTTRSLQKSYTY